ncbi:MAG: PspC domain-containing protein, partial [Microbacterium sp.]|uniref:PspC domain-containing protein n=1 Tax=Microbacterium sp. TaxID=51671 RepID=UPI0039E4B5CF
MDDARIETPADPAPPPPLPGTSGADRFFDWVRGFGIVRADGWLGGVAAGVAARLGIDTALVRGIVAVAAVLGFPMLFLYAIAWALLPDATGRIHARELVHGRFDPAIAGIGILLAVSFVPVTPWLLPTWDGWRGLGIAGWILGLALVGGIVFVVVRGSRRGHPTAPTSSTGEGAVDPAAPPPGPEPLPPDKGAGNADIADWRARHDAWRARDDAWRREHHDGARLAREQA